MLNIFSEQAFSAWTRVVKAAVTELNVRENLEVSIDLESYSALIESELVDMYRTYFGEFAADTLADDLVRAWSDDNVRSAA